MPIRISRNISTLCAERVLQSKTAVSRFVEQVADGTKINRVEGDPIDFNVSEGLRSDNQILNVTIENLSAANSTTRETAVAKEIAILTRKYVLQTSSIAMEDQTQL